MPTVTSRRAARDVIRQILRSEAEMQRAQAQLEAPLAYCNGPIACNNKVTTSMPLRFTVSELELLEGRGDWLKCRLGGPADCAARCGLPELRKGGSRYERRASSEGY